MSGKVFPSKTQSLQVADRRGEPEFVGSWVAFDARGDEELGRLANAAPVPQAVCREWWVREPLVGNEGLLEVVQCSGPHSKGIWSFLCYTFLIEVHSQ